MAPIAGWYDDPRDARQLRYWDGDTWTDQLAAKQVAAPAPAQWSYPGSEPAQQQSWQYGQPAQPAQPAQQAQQGWQPPLPPDAHATPDGARLTSWGKRLAAYILDSIIVFVAGLPVTGYFWYRYLQALSDQGDRGTTSSFFPSAEVLTWVTWAGIAMIVVHLVYDVFCLRRWGATVAMRVLDISVRTWEHGGQLPWPVIWRRLLVVYGLAILFVVPVLGLLASLTGLLNYLWPLWDPRRQALHDKFAGTAVIEGARRETP